MVTSRLDGRATHERNTNVSMTLLPIDPVAPIEPEFRLAAVDLYRDIHKGIRAELFAITSTAGSIDPTNGCDRAALADHVASVGGVLELHAHHEDSVLDPVLEIHMPDLAEEITTDHLRLETSFGRVIDLANSSVDVARGDERRVVQLLHLELASFTSSYLAHQNLEERVVMPRLEGSIGVEQCGALHGAIVGSIPPDELARSLSFMLPAMNLDDRVDMLDGIRMAAPTEAFLAVVGLARSVLQPADFASLAARLQVEW
jgi:Hemerythrin HHE cation binding domain